jgi:hypothetical protein
MGLIFKIDNEGHAQPEIQCDNCGGTIENFADGVALLDTPSPKPGAAIEPIFHCSGCEKKAPKTDTHRHAMPIDHFMLYVLNNIQLTPQALEVAGQRLRTRSDF